MFVSGKLNREATSLYKIEIKAKDMAGLYSENARTGSTWIKINVTDINDCAPKFLSPSYYANVQENTPPDQSVIQVQATDQDVGENSRLSFKLEGDEATFFKIGQSNGIISVNLSLTDKVGVKRFLVVATDNGMPSKNNTANVTINITDTNNHRPEFARDQEVIYISEVSMIVKKLTNSSQDMAQNHSSQCIYQRLCTISIFARLSHLSLCRLIPGISTEKLAAKFMLPFYL